MDFTGRRHEAKPWNPRPEAGTATRQGVRPQAPKGMHKKERKPEESRGCKAKKGKKGKGCEGKKGKECKGMQWKGMQWNGMESREMQMHSMHPPEVLPYPSARARLMRPTPGRSRPVSAGLLRERGDEISDPPIPTLWPARGAQSALPSKNTLALSFFLRWERSRPPLPPFGSRPAPSGPPKGPLQVP